MGGGITKSNLFEKKKESPPLLPIGYKPLSLTDFHTIANQFTSYAEIQAALKVAGLESSELIIGIDFTKSNLLNGNSMNQSL